MTRSPTACAPAVRPPSGAGAGAPAADSLRPRLRASCVLAASAPAAAIAGSGDQRRQLLVRSRRVVVFEFGGLPTEDAARLLAPCAAFSPARSAIRSSAAEMRLMAGRQRSGLLEMRVESSCELSPDRLQTSGGRRSRWAVVRRLQGRQRRRLSSPVSGCAEVAPARAARPRQ